MRVERHGLPADIRSRLHGGRSGGDRQVGRLVLQVQGAADRGVQRTGGQRHPRRDGAARAIERCVECRRPQPGQADHRCQQSLRRFARVHRRVQLRGIGLASDRVGSAAVQRADGQGAAERGRRSEFAGAFQRHRGRGACQCRGDVQSRDADLVQHHRGQGRAAGRRDRHPQDRDLGRLQAVDHDAPVQQLQRRPVEHEVVHSRVVALRVAQLDVRDPQRIGEAARQSARRTLSPVTRGVSHAIAARPGGVLANSSNRTGIATSPPTTPPIHFAARRIRRPAQCRYTVRKRRHGARGSMGLRHRDELARSRCSTARQRQLRRARCW